VPQPAPEGGAASSSSNPLLRNDAAAEGADQRGPAAAAAADDQRRASTAPAGHQGAVGSSKGTRWAARRASQRRPPAPKAALITPAPGRYDPHLPAQGSGGGAGAGAAAYGAAVAAEVGTSGFASGVDRFRGRAGGSGLGPGSYDCAGDAGRAAAAAAGGTLFRAAPAAPHQQAFGRAVGRSRGTGTSSSGGAARNPGPGSYSLEAMGAFARVKRRQQRPQSAGLPLAARGGGDGEGTEALAFSGAAAAAASKGFESSTARFPATRSEAPGPGQYDVTSVLSLQKEVADRAAAGSRRGAFGCTTGRFDFDSQGAGGAMGNASAAAAAVAAAYGDLAASRALQRVGAAAASGRQRQKPSAAFASATRRFIGAAAAPAAPDFASWDGREGTLNGDPAQLGPGAHFKPTDWGCCHRNSSVRGVWPGPAAGATAAAFGSSAARPFAKGRTVVVSGGVDAEGGATSSSAAQVPGPGERLRDLRVAVGGLVFRLLQQFDQVKRALAIH